MSDKSRFQNAFDEHQEAVLKRLAELMIPSNSDMPAASEESIFPVVLDRLQPHAAVCVDEISTLSCAEDDFMSLPEQEQLDRCKDGLSAEFRMVFEAQVLVSYYADPRVKAAIGMPDRPPFPQGFEVQNTDWSVLDPVRARGPMYRECDSR